MNNNERYRPDEKWVEGCDLFWHDEGIGILIPIFGGEQRAAACLECLVDMFEQGYTKGEIIRKLEERVAGIGKTEVEDGQDDATEKN